MEKREQIGLRVPLTLNERLQQIAFEMGVSKNDAVLLLVNIGLRVYEKEFIIQNLPE